MKFNAGGKGRIVPGCEQYMTEDAWLAVGQNMTHMYEIKPLMLPVYTCRLMPSLNVHHANNVHCPTEKRSLSH